MGGKISHSNSLTSLAGWKNPAILRHRSLLPTVCTCRKSHLIQKYSDPETISSLSQLVCTSNEKLKSQRCILWIVIKPFKTETLTKVAMWRKCGTSPDPQTSFALLNATFDPLSGLKKIKIKNTDFNQRRCESENDDPSCGGKDVCVVFICTRTYTKCKSGRTRDQVVVASRRWGYFSRVLNSDWPGKRRHKNTSTKLPSLSYSFWVTSVAPSPFLHGTKLRSKWQQTWASILSDRGWDLMLTDGFFDCGGTRHDKQLLLLINLFDWLTDAQLLWMLLHSLVFQEH